MTQARNFCTVFHRDGHPGKHAFVSLVHEGKVVDVCIVAYLMLKFSSRSQNFLAGIECCVIFQNFNKWKQWEFF